MDANSITNYLNEVFQEIAINGVTSQNSNAIEAFLIEILDSGDYSIFTSTLFLNLIFLLETKETSLIIKHLVQEVKLKSLRVVYTSGSNYDSGVSTAAVTANNNQCCNNKSSDEDELPFFEGLDLPPEGMNAFAKKIDIEDGKEVVRTYLIDHTGQALQLLNVEVKEFIEDLSKLNNNLLDQTYDVIKNQEISDNVPLTEDDL